MNRTIGLLFVVLSVLIAGCTPALKSAMLIRDEGLDSGGEIADEEQAKFALRSLSDSSKFKNLGGLESVDVEKQGFVLKFSTVEYYTTYQNSVSQFSNFSGNAIVTNSASSAPVVEKMNRQYFYEDIQEIRFFGMSEFCENEERGGLSIIFDGYVCVVKLPNDQFVAKGTTRKNVERVAFAISKLSGKKVKTTAEGNLRGLIIDHDLQVTGVVRPSPLEDVPLLSKLISLGDENVEFRDEADVVNRFRAIRGTETLILRTRSGENMKFQVK